MGSHLSFLEGLFDAFERKDIHAVLDGLHPDVDVIQVESLPYGGVYRGHDGFKRLLGDLDAAWQVFDVKPFEYLDAGEKIVVRMTCKATARASGRDIETEMQEVFSFRNGKVSEIKVFYWDTAKVRDVLAAESHFRDS
ncbi:MAG: nuclear transport factor 2 family protein [Roseitalea sp.]|jgi:ketosteroid isomerase-like protein|nr:nuclear transport factor 2 family protein [Roseitalea sp.]MBO6720816.1 nuclear transport factor 2 family protein [Roseitalea sp.]MBO6743963.1 nuclear transport factor 2 family protein [Roseitalea sp.]